MKKIVLFDFDGVIVNTFAMAFQVMKRESDFTKNMFKDMFAGNIYDSLDSLDTRNFPTDEEYYEVYTPSILKTPPYSGVSETFVALHENSVPIYIISSTATGPIQEYFQTFGLERCVTQVLGGDIERSKIKKFHMVQQKTGVSFEEMLFVTDTTGDIVEADSVGIESIAVTYGYHEPARFKKTYPDVKLIDSLVQIVPMVLKS